MSGSREREHRLERDQVSVVYRRFWPVLRRDWPVFAGAAASMVASTLLQLLRPWPLKVVLDYALAPVFLAASGSPSATAGAAGSLHPALVSLLAGLSPQAVVGAAAGAILVIAGLNAIAGYGEAYLGAKGGQLLAYRLRRDLYRHIHRLSLSFHDRARSGDLMLRLTNDMNMVRNMLVPTSLNLLSQALVMLGVAVMMFLVDWRLTLAALAVIPALFLTTSHYTRHIKSAVRKQRRREAEVASTATESVAAIPLVKVYRAEAFEEGRFLNSHRKSFRQGLRATRLQAAFDRRVDLLAALGTCAVIWLGARRAMAGVITPGDLVLLLSYLGMVYRPVRRFSGLSGQLAKGLVAAERVLDLFDVEPEELRAPGARRPDTVRGELRFERVSFGYGPEAIALREISLHVGAGERIALVGHSGAGKTSLVRLVPRLYNPTAGSITLDGIPLESLELAWLRDRIAFVLQETLLLGISVWDNIAYGLEEVSADEVERAARRARIHERILALPEGYATVLEETGTGLSGGERQRIALARAFLRDAPIVILDEPDTFLDRSARDAVWSAIDEVTRGRTALCIVHDVARARFADRIVVLEAGRVVGQGSHEDLLASCPAYRALFLGQVPRPGSEVGSASA